MAARAEGKCRGRVAVPLLAAGVLGMGLAGCTKKDDRVQVFPVKGQVKFKGEATPGAFVVFHAKDAKGPDAPKPTAQVKSDGAFALTSYDAGDGAPAGEYAVTVQWPKLIVTGDGAQAGPNVLPDSYAKPETTPLKVKVEAQPNDLKPFEIGK